MHDDASYVPRELMDEFLAKDPVDRFRTWLQVHHELTDGEQRDLDAEVHATIERAVAEAEASPPPDPSTVLHGVYAE